MTLCRTVVLTLVLFSRVAVGQNVATPPSPDSAERVAAAIRAAYDTGFARLLAALPPSASDSSSDLWPVWVLGQFRARSATWVTMKGDSYLAIGYGRRTPAYLVVVPPGNKALARMQGYLELDPTADILVAQMAPVQVTPTWAGLFLLHQLSLLADHADGSTTTARSPTDEARSDLQAADLELIAADLLAGGRFRAALDTILSRWHPESTGELVDRIVHASPSEMSAVLAVVPSEPERSAAEAQLRGGVFGTSAAIRYCEVHEFGQDSCATVIKALIVAAAAPN